MSRRSDVLQALRDAGGAGLSGEALAGRLDVSRAAVAKHVGTLRALGYGIDARAGSGYVLRSVPDLPLLEEVEPLVRDPYWVRFVGAVETASTNDDAKRLARSDAPEGTVVVASRQVAGRGRLGRPWASPDGGVYLSAVLRPPSSPLAIGALPLVVGLGVARGLESLGCPALLKWPNDVWSGVPGGPGAGKLAGVLLEMQAESDAVEWVVAGVGVNVRASADRFPGGAYVTDHVPGATCPAVAAAVLDGIAATYREFAVAGFEPLLPEYEARSVLSGREVTVADRGGAVRAVGMVAGVDAVGRLVLESNDGHLAITAGDVTLTGSR